MTVRFQINLFDMILYEILSDVSPQWNLYSYRQIYMYMYMQPVHQIIKYLSYCAE